MESKRSRLFVCLVLSLTLVSLLVLGTAGRASAIYSIIYVKYNASGANNGTSWMDAYTDLRSALSAATISDQIWVAKGTYKPGSVRTDTFTLKTGVAVYGGFVGTETALSQRSPVANVTILSGDIGTAGIASDNSYHVVTSSGVNSTAVLDGFTIKAGNANGAYPNGYGGGMYNDSGSPTLRNLTFSSNSAMFYGGGMYTYSGSPLLINVTFSGNHANDGSGMFNYNNSNPTLTNVTFSGNIAASHGGGMYTYSGSPSLTNVTFNGNTAGSEGGGMLNDSSSPSLTDVTFSGNHGSYGGGMYNSSISNPSLTNVTFSGNTASWGGGMYNWSSSPTLTNATFSGNTGQNNGGAMYNDNAGTHIYDSILWGDGATEIYDLSSVVTITDSILAGICPLGATCTHVLNSNPLLGPLANNGGFTKTMALGTGSPAIDTGAQNSLCALTDQRGVSRPQGAACDMGAYEVAAATFADVPTSYWAWWWIERLYADGITGGCASNPLRYCPEANVSRAEMAVFLERGIHGSSFNPPVVTLTFNDTGGNFARYWIEALKSDGITSGCGPSLYCPDASTTRAEMAIFLLRSEHGASYNPPAASGTLFTDVPASYWAAKWIEQLANEGITSGCGTNLYCPDATVTRAQMAVFLMRTFNLP